VADDWLEKLYADDEAWAGERETRGATKSRYQRLKRRRNKPVEADGTRVRVEVTQPREQHRPSITAAVADLVSTDPVQLRRVHQVAYNAAAAAAGWMLGVVAWIGHGLQDAGADRVSDGVWTGLGMVLLTAVAELRTHGWRHPHSHWIVRVAGWCARIPLASALLALALYGPDAAL
jgi:hypothetical protein